MNLFDPVICWILLVWFVLLGACIGSFLNVVVYRLPLGKSLSDPPSHCPKCGHRIRFYDNVPVFGWLMLAGKCRDCREPISVRYPVIEAISTGVFGSIAFMLLRRNGDASIQEFFCLALALSTLVVTLLAAGLIELDGQKVPWKLFIPAVLMGPMVPWLWQESFHVTVFVESARWKFETVHWGMPLRSMVYCFLTAMFFYWAIPDNQNIFWPISCIFLGLYFGSMGIILILSTLILLGVLKLFRRKIHSVQLLLALSTFLYFVPYFFVP